MFLKLFNPFKQRSITNSEIAKPLVQKLLKSLVVLYTSPLQLNQTVTIDRYSGSVRSMNLWYVKLVSKHRSVYLPTSFIYDKIVEVAR